MVINKNKIINTNKLFGGNVYQESNLDFEVESANNQKNIYRKLAHVARAMTSGHAFSDANKRTALVVIKSELADHGIKCNQIALAKSLVRITDKQENRINVIERSIRKNMSQEVYKIDKETIEICKALEYYDIHRKFPFEKVRIDITISKEALEKLEGKNRSKIINDLIVSY